jgi:hypothetical protein
MSQNPHERVATKQLKGIALDLFIDGYDAPCVTDAGKIRRELYRQYHNYYHRNSSEMEAGTELSPGKLRYEIFFYRRNQRWDSTVPIPPPQDSHKWSIYRMYNKIIEETNGFPFVLDIKMRLQDIGIHYSHTRIKLYLGQEGVTFKDASKNSNATKPWATLKRLKISKQQLEAMNEDLDEDEEIYFYDQCSINQEVLRMRKKAGPTGVKVYDGNKTNARTESVTLHYVMNSEGKCIYYDFTTGGTDSILIVKILKAARKKVPADIVNPILISDNLSALAFVL